MLLAFSYLLLITSFGVKYTFAYRKYYVEDDCTSPNNYQKVFFNVPALGADSIGELKPNRFGTYSRMGRDCSIKLVPPEGYGLVLTVLRVDFRNHQGCKDYIEIYQDENEGDKLCGYQAIGKDGKIYFAEGELKIAYHTSEGGMGFSNGFRLIFTATKIGKGSTACSSPNQFKCKNSRCIWAGATCDGINNCGDASDEDPHYSPNCANVMSGVAITAVVLGITTFVAMLVVMCLCCCRTQSEKSQNLRQISLRPNAGYYPLPGYSTLPGYSYGSIGSEPPAFASHPRRLPSLHPAASLEPYKIQQPANSGNRFRCPENEASPSAPPCPAGRTVRDVPNLTQKVEIGYDKPPPYRP